MDRNYLQTLYERNAQERESLEERLWKVRKRMAEFALSEQSLLACIGYVSIRMDAIQQRLFEEEPEIPQESGQLPAEAQVLVAA
jgi:hypothetical protein